MFQPPPFPAWASALLTGRSDIDNNHRLLVSALARLDAICADYAHKLDCGECPPEKALSCNNELYDALGDFLGFLVDHFYAEEQLMKAVGLTVREKKLCDLHKEDHAAISDLILRIIGALDVQQTAGLIRELRAALNTWLERHIEIHDATLVRLLQKPA